MPLAFGIFDHVECREGISLQRLYEDRLGLIAQADRAGFWGYHVAEHHQAVLGSAPSQNVYLAAAARETKQIRLGSLVYCLPFYHPLRLIDEICMLDALSGGRLQVGVGKGINAAEHAHWGHDESTVREVFEESLEVVLAGLGATSLTHEGRHYAFRDVPIHLQPLQQPHPPFWYAGNHDHAARYGMHFLGGGPITRMAAVAAEYRAIFAARSGPARLGPDREPMVGKVAHIFIADTDHEAEQVARRAWAAYHHNLTKVARDYYGTHEGQASPAADPTLSGDFDRARAVEAAIYGSPETVRDYIARYAAESGCNYFAGAFQWGDISHGQATRSLELFAHEVMPAFR